MSADDKRYIARDHLLGEGLGSSMMSYAILYAIHLETGHTPAILKDEVERHGAQYKFTSPDGKDHCGAHNLFNSKFEDSLNVWEAFPAVDEVFEHVNFKDYSWKRSDSSSFQDICNLIKDSPDNWNMKWFQTYSMWYKYQNEVFKLYEFNTDLIKECESLLASHRSERPIVGVSFREEYKKLLKNQPWFNRDNNQQVALGPNYYTQALKLFSPPSFPAGADFLIFSDFPEETKGHFLPFKEALEKAWPSRFFFTDEMSSAKGMCLLSLCDHVINSNSSFSFWGAFLNRNPQKRIVCPKFYLFPPACGANRLNCLWYPPGWTALDDI